MKKETENKIKKIAGKKKEPSRKSVKRGIKKDTDPRVTAKLMRIAEKAALMGFRNNKIADLLDIAEKTFYHWLREDPNFREAINKGRHTRNLDVVKALYDRATGMTITKEQGYSLGEGQFRVEKLKQELAPDVEACKYILSTREPKLWNQKKVIELSGEIENTIIQYELPKKISPNRDKPE